MSFCRFLSAVILACGLSSAVAADDATRWSPLDPAEMRIVWPAAELVAAPQVAESFVAPMGYRVERYLWKAQKPAGTFAIAVLRDLTDDDHYLSGPVDLMKFATAMLRGLEAPTPKALENSERKLVTGNGPALARLFELGPRQCLVLGFYSLASGKPPADAEPLKEGSLRLDGVYCAAAGQPLTGEQAMQAASALKLSHEATEADTKAAKQ